QAMLFAPGTGATCMSESERSETRWVARNDVLWSRLLIASLPVMSGPPWMDASRLHSRRIQRWRCVDFVRETFGERCVDFRRRSGFGRTEGALRVRRKPDLQNGPIRRTSRFDQEDMGLRRAAAAPGGRAARGARGARFGRRPADGRRQVALLSGARAAPRI